MALQAQDLSRKSVADYYDAMYKTAETGKTMKETGALPGSYQEIIDGKLAEKGYLSQKDIFDMKKDLARLDLDERKLVLDRMKSFDVYINPETNDSVSVPPGEAPPPGYTRRAATSSTQLGIPEKRQQNAIADLYDPKYVTGVVDKYTEKYPMAMLGAPDPSSYEDEKLYQRDLKDYQEERQMLERNVLNDIAQDVASTHHKNVGEIIYVPGSGFHDKATKERLYPYTPTF